MASKTERTIINAAGLAQGIVLVTFPAASTIFTSKSEYGLSSTQYGAMFLPQVALAIATSLLGAGLARRISTKRVYLLGLACSTVAMVLLLASTLVKSNQAAAYPMLLVATAFLGAGFGLTVPVLNTYTSVHRDPVHAERQPRAGVGTQRSCHLMPGRIGIVGRRPVLDRRGERHGAAQRDLAQGREDLGLRDVVQRPAPVIRSPGQLPAQPLIQRAELGLGHRPGPERRRAGACALGTGHTISLRFLPGGRPASGLALTR